MKKTTADLKDDQNDGKDDDCDNDDDDDDDHGESVGHDADKPKDSLRASSPIWVSEVSLARTRERGGRGKESLQRSLINFHFHPGNPGTPQSVKTVTANVPQIRKVTTACQVISEFLSERTR